MNDRNGEINLQNVDSVGVMFEYHEHRNVAANFAQTWYLTLFLLDSRIRLFYQRATIVPVTTRRSPASPHTGGATPAFPGF
jgi:hypothetical protein